MPEASQPISQQSPTLETLPCLSRCECERVLNSDDSPVRPLYGHVAIVNAAVVRSKPGKRCLIRFEIETERCGERTILGKIRFKGVDRRVDAISRQLRGNGWGANEASFIPRPLGLIPQWNMALQELAPGQVLNPASPRFLELQPLVARTISKLHATSIELDRTHTVRDELWILVRMLEQTLDTHVGHTTAIRHVIDHLLSQSVGLERSTLATVHRDFYFDQLIDGGSCNLALIDLDLVCQGPPALDVGNYLAHLTELGLREPSLQLPCAAAGRAFLQAYLSFNPSIDALEIEAWHRLSLARHIHLCTKIPGRLHTLVPLLEWFNDVAAAKPRNSLS